MVFQTEKFNEVVKTNIGETFGTLLFMGFQEQQVFEDNKPVDGKFTASHVELFSEKLGDSYEFKLPNDFEIINIPLMAEVVVEGKGSPVIYSFTNRQTRNGQVTEFKDYGISVKIEGLKTKTSQSQPVKPDPKIENK
ncbi:hypothetical protein P7G31_04710 [Streptococcus parauberis]|uniref:DUF961 domain-containing protein n=1 Tax=Streptococcus parauberis TaxID=1348 RepID=A0AAE4L092_9STRE|nr:hypothetical protein [Streptococcus parauberis]MDT2731549.1 hypothetical protein [Streptococcus parauberis]